MKITLLPLNGVHRALISDKEGTAFFVDTFGKVLILKKEFLESLRGGYFTRTEKTFQFYVKDILCEFEHEGLASFIDYVNTVKH